MSPKKKRDKLQRQLEEKETTLNSTVKPQRSQEDNESAQSFRIQLPFKPKQILILWLAKLLPYASIESSVDLKSDRNAQKLYLQGGKYECERWIEKMRKYLQEFIAKKVVFKNDMKDAQRVENQFEMQNEFQGKIFQPKILQQAGRDIHDKYGLKEILEVVKKLGEGERGFLILIIKKAAQERALEKISEIIDMIEQQRRQSKEEAEQFFSLCKNQGKKPLKKLQSPKQIQQKDQGQNEWFVCRRGNRSKPEKIKYFSRQFPRRALDIEHFKNWIRKNRHLTFQEVEITINKQILTVSLISSRQDSNKIDAIKYYLQHQMIIHIQSQSQNSILKILKDIQTEEKNFQFTPRRGHCKPKMTDQALRFYIKSNSCIKSPINTQPFNIVMMIGTLTQLSRIQAKINDLIEGTYKVDLQENILAQIGELKEFLKDQRVRTLIKDQVKQEIYNIGDKLKIQHQVKFTEEKIVIHVSVGFEKKDKFNQDVKKIIAKCISKRIKVHKMTELDSSTFQKYSKDHILFQKDKQYYLIASDEAMVPAIQQILNHQSSGNKLVSRSINFELYKLEKVKEFGEKFIAESGMDGGNLKINYQVKEEDGVVAMDIFGHEKGVQLFCGQVINQIAEFSARFCETVFYIEDQEAEILRKDKKFTSEIQPDCEIFVSVKQNVQLAAVVKIGKSSKVTVLKQRKDSGKFLSKLRRKTTFFFRSTQQLGYCDENSIKKLQEVLTSLSLKNKVDCQDEARGINLSYFPHSGHSQFLTVANKAGIGEQWSLACFMPSKDKGQFLDNVINYLLRSQAQTVAKERNVTIFEMDQKEDIQRCLGISQVKGSQGKKVMWYIEQNGIKMFYSQNGMKKINECVSSDKTLVYLTNQDLNLKIYTHQVCLESQTMTHAKSKTIKPLKLFPDKITFQLQGLEFEFPQTQFDRVSNETKNKKGKINVSIGVYVLDIIKGVQKNLFSGFVRKLQSVEEEVKIKQQFKGKVEVKYGVRVSQLSIFYQSKKRGAVEDIWRKVTNYLETRVVIEVLEMQGQGYSDKEMKDIIALAKQNNVIVELDKNKKQLLVKGYNKSNLSRFLTVLKVLQNNQLKITYPEYWQHQVSEIQIFEVNKTSKQFKEVEKNFKITDIHKLERIQNRILYKKYAEQKNFLIGLNEGNEVKEMMLYHGTKTTSPQIIYGDKEESFNINYTSEKNLLGKGIYFAQLAMYSHDYRHELPASSVVPKAAQMFYCRVLVGQSQKNEKRDSHIRDTNFKNSQKKIRHESITGFLNGSNVYVVYKNRRAYPMYLITYLY